MVARWLQPDFKIVSVLLFGLERLWLRYATLQNWIPSFPWIAPPCPPLWRNPRKGRDRILPSGNLADDHAPAGRRSCKCAPFSPMSHRHNSRFNLIRPLSLASLSPLITFAFAPMDLKSRALSPAPPPVSETNGEIRHEIKRGKNNTCDFTCLPPDTFTQPSQSHLLP